MATDLGMYVKVKATGINQVNDGLDKMAKKAGDAKKSAIDLSSAIAGIASFAAIKKVLSMADSYASMSARMKLATSSMKEFTFVQTHLLNTANRAGRSMSELQNIFIDTSGNLQDMGYSLKDTLKMTDSLTFAFTRNATSAQRAQGALEAWDFALNKKSIDVRTWQRLSTAIPTLEVDLARVYGKSLSEIQQLGFAGKLSVEMINNTLLESYDENEKAAKAMGSSIESATNMLSNNFQALVGDIDSGLGATAAIAASIELVANNIEYLLIPASGIVVVGLVKGFALAKGAVIAFNAALMANPITMVVAGLAMAGVALLSYIKSTKKASEAMSELSATIEEAHANIESMTESMRAEHRMNLEISFDYDRREFLQLQGEIEAAKKKLEALTKVKMNGGSKGFGSSGLDKSIAEAEANLVRLEAKSDRMWISLSATQDKFKDLIILNGESAESGLRHSQAYLDMQESITQQIVKSNLKGIEGAITYERIYGTLKDIEETEYQTLLIRGRSADAGERLLRQQQQIASKTEDIKARYAKRNMSALDAEIFDLEAMGLVGKELEDAKQKLVAIYSSMDSRSSKTDVFGDRLVSLSQELSAMQALNSEMSIYGQASKYNAVKELTLEFENQSSALYKLSEAQKATLLTQASLLDSQKQMNEILSMAYDADRAIDDLLFEAEMIGKLSGEVERLTFFRDLDIKAKEISIGMSEENIAKLNEEIEKIKELYGLYEKKRDIDENSIGKGFELGMQKYIDSVGNMRDQFADATESVLNHMESFLVDFAHTGKLNFRDMTTSILQDISRMMIQISMMQAVTGMQSWFKGLGLFSGGGSVPVNAWSGGYIPEYANGGQVIDFSGGGFTGAGGKFEPMGIVHGGEFVMSKEAVNNLGVGYLENLHNSAKSGAKGYSSGGFVGTPPIMPSIPTPQQIQQKAEPIHIEIIVNNEDGTIETNAAQVSAELKREVEVIVDNRVSYHSKRSGGMLRR